MLLFMGYLRRKSKYPERISQNVPTHITSMTDPIAIDIEIPKIYGMCFFKKEFTKLICMNR